MYNKPNQRPAPSSLVRLIGRALHRYHRVQGFESHTGFFFATLIDQKTGKSLIDRWMVAMDQQIVGAGRSMEFSVIKPRFFATRHRNISLQECLLSPLHRSDEALTTEQPRLPYGE